MFHPDEGRSKQRVTDINELYLLDGFCAGLTHMRPRIEAYDRQGAFIPVLAPERFKRHPLAVHVGPG